MRKQLTLLLLGVLLLLAGSCHAQGQSETPSNTVDPIQGLKQPRPQQPSPAQQLDLPDLRMVTERLWISGMPAGKNQIEKLPGLGFEALVNVGHGDQLPDGSRLGTLAPKLGLKYVELGADQEQDWTAEKMWGLNGLLEPIAENKLLIFGQKVGDFGKVITVALSLVEKLPLHEALFVGQMFGMDAEGSTQVKEFLVKQPGYQAQQQPQQTQQQLQQSQQPQQPLQQSQTGNTWQAGGAIPSSDQSSQMGGAGDQAIAQRQTQQIHLASSAPRGR